MKKTILIIALLSTVFCFTSLTESDELGTAADEDVLMVDSGDLNNTSLDMLIDPGLAEAVKLKPPTPGWTLEKVLIAGWDLYAENETIPNESLFCIEIRDKDLKLLYKYADSQLAYFHYPLPNTWIIAEIEIPSLQVSDEFYVCFYDRGAVAVAYEFTDSGESSFIYNKYTGETAPSMMMINETEEPVPINWYIRAVGH